MNGNWGKFGVGGDEQIKMRSVKFKDNRLVCNVRGDVRFGF